MINDIYRYLGVKEQSKELTSKIELLKEEIDKEIKPSFISSTFNISKKENGIELDNTGIVLTGNLVKTHFADVSKVILIIATLSLKSEIILKRMFSRNAESGVIADAILTDKLETFLDEYESNIKKQYKKEKSRISCGYGDLDISFEKPLFDILNASSLGVSINDSYMLLPNKSVIALIGVDEWIS